MINQEKTKTVATDRQKGAKHQTAIPGEADTLMEGRND